MKVRSNSKVNNDFTKLAELKQQRKALDEEIAKMEESIIQYMQSHDTDTLEGTEHSVTYKLIVSHRIDTKELKKHHPKIAEKFTVLSEYMRFSFK